MDFACLQETGISGSKPPPALRDLVVQAGYSILVHGAGEDDEKDTEFISVAVVAASSWQVGTVKRDPHGRALGVVLKREGFELLVVSVLMPTGLDTTPFDSANGKRAVALEVTTTIEEWKREYPMHIIGGDFNQTVRLGLDRSAKGGWAGGVSGSKGEVARLTAAPSGTCVDLFAALHPTSAGYTHEQALGLKHGVQEKSMARLDYVLVSRDLYELVQQTEGQWRCEVDYSHCPSDHHVVEVTASSTGLPARPRNRKTKWVPRAPALHKANPRQTQNAMLAVDAQCRKLMQHIELKRAQGDSNVAIVNYAIPLLVGILRESCIKFMGNKQSARKRPPMMDIRTWRAITAIRGMRDAIWAVNNTQSDTCSPRFQRAVEKLIRSGSRPEFDLTNGGTMENWESWLASSQETLDSLQQEAAIHAAALESEEVDKKRKMFADPKQRGRFYETYLRDRTTATLNSAVDAAGNVVTNAQAYMTIIRDKVSEPMSVFHPLPTEFDEKLVKASHDAMKLRKSSSKLGVLPSLAANDVKCVPKWWDSAYGAEHCNPLGKSVFLNIMNPMTIQELRSCIRKANGGKADDKDGISIDLLKLVVNPDLLRPPNQPKESAPPQDTHAMQVIHYLVNLMLENRALCDFLKEGRITMVPKNEGVEDNAGNVANMRPITVIPELNKLISKVFADRIGLILAKNPSLLHEAQRAFLMNGSVSQCLESFVDVLEDWNKNKRGKKSPLYVVSYDQSKAYDSVQLYSIKAALVRLGFPAEFVEYTLSTMDRARSSVRTWDGPTDTFNLNSSVRQGDPLAPLLFIFINDMLHCGLRNNPLDKNKNAAPCGYRMSNPQGRVPVIISSIGYADDCIIMAESETEIRRMHTWVRSFFGAHCWKFNAKKTQYMVASFDTTLHKRTKPLTTVDGQEFIWPRDQNFVFRYLGMWFTLSLNWTTQIKKLHRWVLLLARRMRMQKLELHMSADVVNNYFIPKANAAITIATIPKTKLKEWTLMFRKAALQASQVARCSSLTKAGFHVHTGMRRLEDLQVVLGGTELMVRLNTSDIADSSPMHCRMRDGAGVAQENASEGFEDSALLKAPTVPFSRAWEVTKRLATLDVRLWNNKKPWNTYPTTPAGQQEGSPEPEVPQTTTSLQGNNVQPHNLTSENPTSPWSTEPPVLTPEPTLSPGPELVHIPEITPSEPSPMVDLSPTATPVKPLWTPADLPRTWDPHSGQRIVVTHTNHMRRGVVAFTDGSTLGESGFGIVFPNAQADTSISEQEETDRVIIKGPLRSGGNNYIAELVAILGTLVLVPGQMDLIICTDSKAAMYAIQKEFVSERKRIRAAARAYIGFIRRLVKQRRGTTIICHVKAHTTKDCPRTRMNALADEAANQGREEMDEDVPAFDLGEDRVIMHIGGMPVVGDFRKALQRRTDALLLAEYQQCETHGRLIRTYPNGLMALINYAKKAMNGPLIKFLMLAACQHLPCAETRARFSGLDPQCTLCSQGVSESCQHVFACPRNGRGDQALREEILDIIGVHEKRPWFSDLQLPIDKMTLEMSQQIGPSLQDEWPGLSVREMRNIIRLYVRVCYDTNATPSSDELREIITVVQGNQRIGRRGSWSPPHSLTRTLRRHLKLHTIGFASAAQVPASYHRWLSEHEIDRELGADGTTMGEEWAGRYLLLPIPLSATDANVRTPNTLSLTEKTTLALDSETPTRILLIGEVNPLLKGIPRTKSLCSFTTRASAGYPPTRIEVLLAQNECASSWDPVNWGSLQKALVAIGKSGPQGVTDWATGDLDIEDPCEEGPRHYQGRCSRPQQPASAATHNAPGSAVFNWFDFSQDPASSWYRDYTGDTEAERDANTRSSIKQMRDMDRYAGYLGILPPGFSRLLAWEVGSDETGWGPCDRQQISDRMDRIRKTLLFNAMKVAAERDKLHDMWWKYGATNSDISKLAAVAVGRKLDKENKRRQSNAAAALIKRVENPRYSLRPRPRLHDRGPYLGDDVDDGREEKIINLTTTLTRKFRKGRKRG